MNIKSIKKTLQEARKKGNQDYIDYKTGTLEFFWCCDCHLRHVIIYDVIRGKKPSEDIVRVRIERDDLATDLRRYYCEKEMSKKRKKRK